MAFTFFLICFGVGLLFTLSSVFFGHMFGGHDAHTDLGTGGHAEAGFEHTGMPGFSPFSPTTICSFLTAFGGLGMILTNIDATKPLWMSIPLSLLGALFIAFGVFWLFNSIFKATQSSSESRVGNLAGRTATVISPIPPNGVGEIAYVHGGSRYTAPAREEYGRGVASGQTVKITRIAESQFFVAIE